MAVQHIQLKLIKPNPYQPRLMMDEAKTKELAASIQEHGLLEPPQVRAVDGTYQLVFGHRRFAAWKIAKPGQPFPCEPVKLADRQMFERALAENDDREPLNPVERARALDRYLKEFKVTQAEAAPRFKLESQGAVSNTLRLLRLPDAVLDLVALGELAERDARKLVPLMRFMPKKAGEIAKDVVARVKPDERSEAVDYAINRFLWQEARSFDHAVWKLDWPGESIRVEHPNNKLGEPGEVPACKGCEFAVHSRGQGFCIRPGCFDLKGRLYRQRAVDDASKRLGIPVAGADEKTTVVFDGSQYDYRLPGKVRAMLKAKLKCLRIEPNEKHGQSWSVKEILGGGHVMLTTVDKKAVESWKSGAKKAAIKNETPAEKAKRAKREEIESDARRSERAAALKAKHDVSWLVINTAKLLAGLIHVSGGVLDLVNEAINEEISMEYDIIQTRIGYLEGELEKAHDSEREKLGRELLALKFVGDELPRYKAEYNFDEMRKDILALVTSKGARNYERSFNVPLSQGWDRPPIHHTEYNCWHCGVFASSTKLTKRNLVEGWGQVLKGKELQDVHCPDCAPKPVKAKAKGKKK